MKKLVLACLAAAATGPAFAQEVDSTRVVRPYWWDQPVVEALGRTTIEIASNRASFNVAFVETNSDSGRAMEAAVAKGKLASEAIKKVAGDKARVQTAVGVDPYYEQYRNDDGQMVDNIRPDKVRGYRARVSVSVTLSDPALASRARAAALALGPENSGAIRYYLEETPEIQRAAMKAAAEDALARAEAVAAGAGAALGDLLVLQEGQGPCMGSWSSRQVARQVGSPPPAPPRPAPTNAAMPVDVFTGEDVVVTGAMIGDRRIEITEADLQRLDLPSDETPQTATASVCTVYALRK
jgi:uncharacterized protein YggE